MFEYEVAKDLVEGDLLNIEIKSQLPFLKDLTTNPGSVFVYSDQELTAEQVTLLNQIVTNHNPSNVFSNEYKIHAYFDSRKYNKLFPPIDIDFITGLNIKLHRKSILIKGECQAEEYYADYDGTTYSNLVVKESHVFTRDPLGFATKRTTTVSWMKNSGSFGSVTKTLTKFYSDLEKIAEGKTRRGNLVDNLQMPTIGLISLAVLGTTTPTLAVIVQGRAFLADYKIEFDNFVSASDKTILQCFTNPAHARYMSASTYPWIDFVIPNTGGATIRQYLANELNI